jgi:hypothetical protein
VTSLQPPLLASSAMSVGDLGMVESLASEEPTTEALEESVSVTLGADGASYGIACIEVDGANSQLSDDVGGLLWDLVKHSADIVVP